MTETNFIVQASTRSWSGGRDICFNSLEGKPVVWHTLSKILTYFPNAKVVVAAPAFDAPESWLPVTETFGNRISLYFGHSESPLERLLAAHAQYFTANHFVRLDGLNFSFLPAIVGDMLAIAQASELDCVRFRDSFPAQLTADVYGATALKKLAATLPADSPFRIHPKYALASRKEFVTAEVMPFVSPADFEVARKKGHEIYLDPRDEITAQRVAGGDTLTFHYQLALEYLRPPSKVLDVACGSGVGSLLLAQAKHEVWGVDLSDECIGRAQEEAKNFPGERLQFQQGDVTNLSFADNTFDAVTSFETIEHVDASPYLAQIRRVLKPNGLLLLSTPQNCLGKVPINSQHHIEYSLQEILALVRSHFDVENVTGIKQGCIYFPNDPNGSNTFLVLRNRKSGS